MDESAGSNSSRYKDAEMLLSVSTAREIATVDSALVLVSPGGAGERLLKQVRVRVKNLGRTLQEDVDAFYEERTGQAPRSELSPDEKAAAERVLERTMSLAESLEKMMRRGGPGDGVEGLDRLYQTEVRNLVDGERTVLDIYRTVRAASLSTGEWYYGPVERDDVVSVLEASEKSGAIRIKSR